MTISPVARDGGSVLAVRLQPGASRAGLVGVQGDVLRVRVASPPVDGRANDELCAVLASALALRPRQVTVIGGHTARSKTVWVDLAPEVVAERLGPLASDEG